MTSDEKTDIPVPAQAPHLPRTKLEKDFSSRVIVVLEAATLEIVKVGKGKEGKYHLLNSDDHQNVLRKHSKEISEYRPDITHQVSCLLCDLKPQCLLALLDSPLNKAGKLQVYIRTQNNVLIEINPQTRIPRTFVRFAGLMGKPGCIRSAYHAVQLLHKLSIRAVGTHEKLLNIIRNPITDHLPTHCQRIGMSGDAPVVKIAEYIRTLPPTEPVVFFIGAMSHGEDDFDFAEKKISVSEYPLAAATVCSKVCHAYEELWDIV